MQRMPLQKQHCTASPADASSSADEDILFAAAETGDFGALNNLLARRPDLDVDIKRRLDDNNDDNTLWSPLQRAAHFGHRHVVWKLLNHGADPNFPPGVFGPRSFALNHAVMRNHVHVARILIEKGAATTACLREATSAEMAELLLQHGESIHETGYDLSALGHAKNRQVAKVFLNQGANVHETGRDGDTPLHIAAINGRVDVVQFLLENGADVNEARYPEWRQYKVTFGHERPLHFAVCSENVALVRLLLVNGASVDCKDLHDKAPLDYCADMLRDTMEATFAIWRRYWRYFITPDWKLIRSYLSRAKELGISLDGAKSPCYVIPREDEDEDLTEFMSILHYAVVEDEDEMMEQLLDVVGMDVNLRDPDGSTPLHLAVEGFDSRLECAEILIRHGANVNAQDHLGDAPLHRVCKLISEGEHGTDAYDLVMILLLEAEPDLTLANKHGKTPLHLALDRDLTRNTLGCAEYLVQYGANVNAQDGQGDTPLHCVCWLISEERGDREIYHNFIDLLVQAGADLTITNNDGETPFETVLNKRLDAEFILMLGHIFGEEQEKL